jgi:hypothetical protein
MSVKFVKRIQKKQVTKISIVMTLVLLLSISASSIVPAYAHTPPWNIPTYAYVSASPNTVGVGEYTLIVMWLDKYPPTAGGAGGDRWRGFALDITKPDGTKQHLGPFEPTSQVGSTWTTYKCFPMEQEYLIILGFRMLVICLKAQQVILLL